MTEEKPQTPADDLSHEAAQLSAAVNKLNVDMGDQIVAMAQIQRRDRRVVRWLGISVFLDIILSLSMAVLGVVALNASHRAEEATSLSAQNKQNAVITCQAANQSREAQVALWNYVLSLAGPNPTQSQQEQIRKFKVYLNQVFAQRDCNHPEIVPSIPPPPVPVR